jgi:hypothetical protein
MKRHDNDMRSIPSKSGNIPVPAILKVPIGIPKERRAVAIPKRKITIPPTISSLFTHFPRAFQISNFRFPLVSAQKHENEIKQKMIVLLNSKCQIRKP